MRCRSCPFRSWHVVASPLAAAAAVRHRHSGQLHEPALAATRPSCKAAASGVASEQRRRRRLRASAEPVTAVSSGTDASRTPAARVPPPAAAVLLCCCSSDRLCRTTACALACSPRCCSAGLGLLWLGAAAWCRRGLMTPVRRSPAAVRRRRRVDCNCCVWPGLLAFKSMTALLLRVTAAVTRTTSVRGNFTLNDFGHRVRGPAGVPRHQPFQVYPLVCRPQ